MVKFLKKVMGPAANIYKSGATGRFYTFRKDRPTKVDDQEDIKHFKNHPDFEEITKLKEAKEKIVDKAKEIKKKKEPTYKEKLIALKSVEDELADAIINYYPTWEQFYDNVDDKTLRSISGIGSKRAKSIITQIEAMKIEKEEE